MQKSEKKWSFASVGQLIHSHQYDLNAIAGLLLESLVADGYQRQTRADQSPGNNGYARVHTELTFVIDAVDRLHTQEDRAGPQKQAGKALHSPISSVLIPDVDFKDVFRTDDIFTHLDKVFVKTHDFVGDKVADLFAFVGDVFTDVVSDLGFLIAASLKKEKVSGLRL